MVAILAYGAVRICGGDGYYRGGWHHKMSLTFKIITGAFLVGWVIGTTITSGILCFNANLPGKFLGQIFNDCSEDGVVVLVKGRSASYQGLSAFVFVVVAIPYVFSTGGGDIGGY